MARENPDDIDFELKAERNDQLTRIADALEAIWHHLSRGNAPPKAYIAHQKSKAEGGV
jgi:hypothetical protein